MLAHVGLFEGTRVFDAHADELLLPRFDHAAYPVALPAADLEFLAHLRAEAGRLARHEGGVEHLLGRRAGIRIGLPRTFVQVAARPAIRADALALIGDIAPFVTLALPWPATPGIGPLSMLVIVGELALIAVAIGPGFHAATVLAPRLELAVVARDARGDAFALGEPVHARSGVRALKLRIQHAARLRPCRQSNECQTRGRGGRGPASSLHHSMILPGRHCIAGLVERPRHADAAGGDIERRPLAPRLAPRFPGKRPGRVAKE